jgi:threonine-phosphate decarboxylase
MNDFSHGGNVELFAKQLSCEESDIIDLSSNINFLKPQVNFDLNDINISTYPTYTKLYQAIANNYNTNIENIELYNGGSSAIFELFNNLKLNHCTIYSPAYLEYKKAAITYNYEYDLINRFTNITRAVKENSLVIFVNPSTPDGKYYDIEEYLEAWHKLGCTILIDESFLDFTNYKSVLKYVNKYKRLYILKSMTKYYSCAGIRCGVIISNSTNIQKLRHTTAQWKLSVLDSHFIINALKDDLFKKTSKAINIKNHQYLYKVLYNFKYTQEIYHSDANFYLIKLKNTNVQLLQKHLKKYKIMIRDCSNFDFLDYSYARIAVKDVNSIYALKDALDSF